MEDDVFVFSPAKMKRCNLGFTQAEVDADFLLVTTCGCSDSHGYSWDKNGVTEEYQVKRCLNHRDKPSIYRNLQ